MDAQQPGHREGADGGLPLTRRELRARAAGVQTEPAWPDPTEGRGGIDESIPDGGWQGGWPAGTPAGAAEVTAESARAAADADSWGVTVGWAVRHDLPPTLPPEPDEGDDVRWDAVSVGDERPAVRVEELHTDLSDPVPETRSGRRRARAGRGEPIDGQDDGPTGTAGGDDDLTVPNELAVPDEAAVPDDDLAVPDEAAVPDDDLAAPDDLAAADQAAAPDDDLAAPDDGPPRRVSVLGGSADSRSSAWPTVDAFGGGVLHGAPVAVPFPELAAAEPGAPDAPPFVAPEPPVFVAPEPPVFVAPEPPVFVAPEPPVFVAPEPPVYAGGAATALGTASAAGPTALPTLDDLLATRRPAPTGPAEIGWRGVVRRISGGVITLPPGVAEREDREAIATVQRSLEGPRTVVVINPKGGAHKTTASLMIAATFGRHRGGYTLAWDNNETRGTLGWRSRHGNHRNTAVDLLDDLERFADGGTSRVGDLDNYVRSQGSAQFDVLASDEDAASAASIDDFAFRALHRTLERFYRILVIDTGNNMRASNWQAAIDAADQVVVVSTMREDTSQSAAWALDALRATGHEDVVRRAVTVLTQPAPKRDAELAARLHDHFGRLTRVVLEVPYEPVLVPGGPIDYEALSDAGRRAWLHVSAAVAEGL